MKVSASAPVSEANTADAALPQTCRIVLCPPLTGLEDTLLL